MSVYRCYSQKKPGFDVEAQGLCKALREQLGVAGLTSVAILNRYDADQIDPAVYQQAKGIVFSEPQVDVVYDETFPQPPQPCSLLAVEALPKSKRPRVVCIAHGYLFDQNTSAAKTALLAGAEKLTAPVTDLVLTMNRWDFDYASAHRLGRRVANIPGMGVDFSPLDRADPQAGLALREELGFGPDRFLLVYGAEFSRRKSQAVLLRALARLPERAALLLPGQGDLLPSCQALAHELGVADRVVFPGHVSMAAWYAAANAVVPSSRSEGLPFNLMEAMHCGLPAVASDVKGHQDLICHGESGLLYPYGDDAACARQIQILMDDPQLARSLGRAGQKAMEPFRLEAVFPCVMAEYDRLLSPAPALV